LPTPLLAPVTTHSLPAMLPAECAAAAMGVVQCAACGSFGAARKLVLFRRQRVAGVVATSAADGSSVEPAKLELAAARHHALITRSTRARRRRGRRDPPAPATPATLSYRRGVISQFLGPRPYTFGSNAYCAHRPATVCRSHAFQGDHQHDWQGRRWRWGRGEPAGGRRRGPTAVSSPALMSNHLSIFEVCQCDNCTPVVSESRDTAQVELEKILSSQDNVATVSRARPCLSLALATLESL